MVFGYARVSSIKQDTDNQKGEIERWAERNNLVVDNYIAETISSRVEDREIFALVAGLREGDILVASEVSRFARSTIEFLSIVNELVSRKVRVIFIKENFDFTDGNPFIMFGATLVAAFAQLERSMNSMRTREAIVSRRNEVAKKLKKELGREPSEDEIKKAFGAGRKLGSKNKSKKLDGKETIIKGYLDKKLNKSAIAKLLGVSRDVLYDKLSEMKEQGMLREENI